MKLQSWQRHITADTSPGHRAMFPDLLHSHMARLGEVMDTLVHIHQQKNPFLYQNSPQGFHTFLNVPQENFSPSCTAGSWSFPGKTAFLVYSHPALPQASSNSSRKHFLCSCPGPIWLCYYEGRLCELCVPGGGSLDLRSTCRALRGAAASAPPHTLAGASPAQVCRGQTIPGLAGTDGELGFGFPDMIPV